MSIKMNKDLYIIECVTNLHVGSGDNDFGLIDNKVQRDVITNYPTINASSLKGAFASHFNSGEDKDKKIRTEVGKKIFGRGNDTENGLEGQGKYKFFPANLLAIPVRSSDKPYYLVTSDQIIEDYNEMAELFNQEEIKTSEIKPTGKVELEGKEVDKRVIDIKFLKHLEEEILIVEDDELKEIVENLPVIARNHLDNGESKNLWYEEIVPRKSIFYFGIDKGVAENEYENKFNEKILFEYKDSEGNKKEKKNIIHIGGNVTVGFGACKIMKLGDIND